MKTTKYLFAAFGTAALTLAACHQDDGAQPGTVHIVTAIHGPQTRVLMNADGSGRFQDNDRLKLAIYGTEATPLQTTYTIGGSALYWADVSFTLGQTDTYTFAAWYNGDDALDLVAGPSFNVAAAADAHKDLLLASPVRAAVEQTVLLSFSHAMHKLVVNLSYGEGFDGLDKTKVTVTPVKMNAAATIDVKTGKVTVGEAGEADGTYPTVTMGDATSCSFILAPQKLTTGADWLDINLPNGMRFAFPVPATFTDASGQPVSLTQLGAGQSLTLNLTVSKNGVELTTGDIQAWGSQGSYTGNAEYVYE